jgi:hypothetical protein
MPYSTTSCASSTSDVSPPLGVLAAIDARGPCPSPVTILDGSALVTTAVEERGTAKFHPCFKMAKNHSASGKAWVRRKR